MELVSGTLTPEQMLDQIPEISEIFSSLAVETLFVEFGWGSNEQWTTTQIHTKELCTFVKESMSRSAFIPGASDLFIRDGGQTGQFKLCHESDIHLVTENQALGDRVATLWNKEGLGGHKSAGVGVWSPIS
jgi:hypothetical protein